MVTHLGRGRHGRGWPPRRSTVDRRNYALHLTSKGETTMRDVGRAARDHGLAFLAPLDEDEHATLAACWARLAEHHGLTPGVHPGYRPRPRRRTTGAGHQAG